MAKANKRIVPYPKQFSASAVQRMLGDGFQAFCDDYQDNLYVRKNMQPSDKDRSIAYEFKKGALVAELVRKHKMSYSRINTSIYRVAREAFLKDK